MVKWVSKIRGTSHERLGKFLRSEGITKEYNSAIDRGSSLNELRSFLYDKGFETSRYTIQKDMFHRFGYNRIMNIYHARVSNFGKSAALSTSAYARIFNSESIRVIVERKTKSGDTNYSTEWIDVDENMNINDAVDEFFENYTPSESHTPIEGTVTSIRIA